MHEPTPGVVQSSPADALPHGTGPAREVPRSAWIGLAIVFLALALLYSYVIPLRYGPDEPRHFAYVKRLVEKHALPGYDSQGNELDGAIVFHPPGYYLLLSPLYLATRGLGEDACLRALRATSPLLIGLALWLFALALGRLYPDRPLLRFTVVAVFALLPHVLLEAAVMNNDVLAITLGAALFYQWARLNDRLPTSYESLAMGLTMALFVNTKAQGLTVSPLWALWMACACGRAFWRQRAFWSALAWAYLPLLLLGSPWFIHNQRVYGVPLLIAGGSEPLDGRGRPYAAGQLLLEGLLLLPTFWLLLGRGVWGLFRSYWAQVGWFPRLWAPWLYGGLLAGTLLALPGQVKLVRGARRVGLAWWQAWPRAARFAFLAYFLVWLNILAVAVFKHIGWYEGGRYTLPVGYGLVLFLVQGWLAFWESERRQRWVAAKAVVVFGLLNVLCLYNLLTYLNPLYAPQWRPFG